MGTFFLYYSSGDWFWRDNYSVINRFNFVCAYQRSVLVSFHKLILDQATATGMSYLFRSTGSVVGITTSQCVLQNLLKRWLTARIHGADAEMVTLSTKSELMLDYYKSKRICGHDL